MSTNVTTARTWRCSRRVFQASDDENPPDRCTISIPTCTLYIYYVSTVQKPRNTSITVTRYLPTYTWQHNIIHFISRWWFRKNREVVLYMILQRCTNIFVFERYPLANGTSCPINPNPFRPINGPAETCVIYYIIVRINDGALREKLQIFVQSRGFLGNVLFKKKSYSFLLTNLFSDIRVYNVRYAETSQKLYFRSVV